MGRKNASLATSLAVSLFVGDMNSHAIEARPGLGAGYSPAQVL
jgi:hypothetical protein